MVKLPLLSFKLGALDADVNHVETARIDMLYLYYKFCFRENTEKSNLEQNKNE